MQLLLSNYELVIYDSLIEYSYTAYAELRPQIK